jgi:transcriptional regulator with XRE-family HTH domain
VVFIHVRNREQAVISMELKAKIKLIRNHLSLTQDQMAEKLGLTSDSRRARISEWESGRGEPKRDILLKYAEIGEVDIKKLLDDRENIDI